MDLERDALAAVLPIVWNMKRERVDAFFTQEDKRKTFSSRLMCL